MDISIYMKTDGGLAETKTLYLQKKNKTCVKQKFKTLDS